MNPNSTKPFRRSRGFSLIELMIAVAIVGILAAIAVPAYKEQLRRGAVEEGLAGLGHARVAAEQFFLDNHTYVGFNCTAFGSTKFPITCADDLETAAYVLTATGNANVTGFVYTIDQAGARTTAGPWGSASCWITRKGETC